MLCWLVGPAPFVTAMCHRRRRPRIAATGERTWIREGGTQYMRRPFRTVNRKWFAAAEAALATLVGASAMYAQGRWKELAPVSCPPPLLCPSEGMAVGGVGEVIVGAYGFA